MCVCDGGGGGEKRSRWRADGNVHAYVFQPPGLRWRWINCSYNKLVHSNLTTHSLSDPARIQKVLSGGGGGGGGAPTLTTFFN